MLQGRSRSFASDLRPGIHAGSGRDCKGAGRVAGRGVAAARYSATGFMWFDYPASSSGLRCKKRSINAPPRSASSSPKLATVL